MSVLEPEAAVPHPVAVTGLVVDDPPDSEVVVPLPAPPEFPHAPVRRATTTAADMKASDLRDRL